MRRPHLGRLSLLLMLWLCLTMNPSHDHPSCAVAQSCEAWDRQPSFCAQFDSWKGPNVFIFVPENQTLDYLKERVAAKVNFVGIFGEDGSLASRCNRFWARLTCATYLRPCVSVPGEEGQEQVLTEPVQPCQSSCFEYDKLCREHLERLGVPFGKGLYFPPGYSAPLTCQEKETNGQAFYQSASYAVSSNETETYNVTCNVADPNGTAFLICEEPLKTVESSGCGFTCPLPSYTEGQYDAIKDLQSTLAWFSWGGSLVVILSYSLHSTLRHFPANLILMTAVAAHIQSVGMILPTFVGYHNTWCGFDTTYVTPEAYLRPASSNTEEGIFGLHFHLSKLRVQSGLCTFQGWLVQMGFLSSTMWWGIVAFNMFLSVFLGRKLPNTKRWNLALQVVFHVCGWVVPCFLMIIPAAAEAISFGPGSTFCSLDSAGIFFLLFWALPVGIILVVGTLLFVTSLTRLLRFAYQLHELRKACGTYFRVVLFILIYFVLITFIFAYSLRVVSAKDSIEEGYAHYYVCLIRRFDNCTLSDGVHNYPLAVLRSIGYSSLGLLLFLTFCITPAMGRFWWRFFDNLRQGRFTDLLTSDKTQSINNSGKNNYKTASRNSNNNNISSTTVMPPEVAMESVVDEEDQSNT
ncbi:hypothetical protein QOT17_013616 [Balamuthia mandrillaris]